MMPTGLVIVDLRLDRSEKQPDRMPISGIITAITLGHQMEQRSAKENPGPGISDEKIPPAIYPDRY
jgi:hypothetical protein